MHSAELCLKLGLNPEVLKIRDIDSFWETGIDPAIQRMRHEAYVQRRHDLMKQSRKERKKLMNMEFEAATTVSSAAVTMTPEMILEQQREAGATLIQLELARIEKMQKRQEKELEQMISFEVKRSQTQMEMEKKAAAEVKKEELLKKKQEKRLKLMAEERRLRELQRTAMEEAEESNRREQARSMHEKELLLVEAKNKKLIEDKIRAREEDFEKKKKNEESRLEVQRYFEEEQMKLRERLESMHVAEKKKQDAIIERQKVHAEKLRIKRAMIDERIEKNMELSHQIEQKKKNDFMKKQEDFEIARTAHLEQQERARHLLSQEILMQEQRRRMILLQKRKEEELKSEEMLIKFEEDEKFIEEVKAVATYEHELVKEKKALKTQMKLENVERVSRMAEFKRMSTVKKIEDVDNRVKVMLDQRKSLTQDRKKSSAQAKLQKEQIARVMEEVRTNASKANQLITKALSGQLNIADFSAGKKQNKPAKTKSATLGGARARESQSAGGNYDSTTGNTVEGGGDNNHQYFDTSDVSAQKPYVSPYDSF